MGAEMKKPDLTGNKFGRLLVVSFHEDGSNGGKWRCSCDCGKEKVAYGSNLVSGATKSCGCYRREATAARSTKHGHKGDEKQTRTYTTWAGMKNRCLNIKYHGYKDYGGRGITICEQWEIFENFLLDMGCRPKGMTLDRIDNTAGYSKDNCRWASLADQMNNTRGNYFVEYQGEQITLANLSRKTGVDYKLLQTRISMLGWPIDDAINRKKRAKRPTCGKLLQGRT
jgi:hypothetical protein